ncbi:MAG: GH3 auxin-responsive promoter family protein [Caldilineaceae bacterium]|nr:GH3 auxin-responsive promoter family protein [Caldilineaceae bacterium]
MLRFLANSLWILLSTPEALRWRQATHRVEAVQREILFQILRRNAVTHYALRISPSIPHSVEEFQRRFPLTTYEDYLPWVERIEAADANVLTAEPVQLLEPTSGSTAATKLIPYTASLKSEFQRGIAPWVVHTFLRDLALLRGQAYWSVTPVTARNRRSPGGIPIGFEEESEYFGRVEGRLIESVMAAPPAVKLIAHMESFRYVTLLFLLRSRDLALISVWNPTFLTLLVEPLTQWAYQLADDITAGTITPPVSLDGDLHRLLSARNRPDPRRGEEIRQILGAPLSPPQRHAQLWPRLRLISCWADANAARYAHALGRLFPQARLQPKGLLATEGFISFPVDGQPGAALSLRSHFFEFIPVEHAADPPLLTHQLEMGGQYEVVITTGGGLYRYRLGDVVEVTGFISQCPLIRFIGRSGAISDWFGEKLDERHVRALLDRALSAQDRTPSFAMLACDDELTPPAYALYIEDNAPDTVIESIRAEVERGLAENVHYAYCRALGQLDALRAFRIREDALSTYMAACVEQGQRAGDIKPVSLHRQSGWSRRFDGNFLPGRDA